MAYLRKHRGKWQSVVRIKGHTNIARSFTQRSDAKRWGQETELIVSELYPQVGVRIYILYIIYFNSSTAVAVAVVAAVVCPHPRPRPSSVVVVKSSGPSNRCHSGIALIARISPISAASSRPFPWEGIRWERQCRKRKAEEFCASWHGKGTDDNWYRMLVSRNDGPSEVFKIGEEGPGVVVDWNDVPLHMRPAVCKRFLRGEQCRENCRYLHQGHYVQWLQEQRRKEKERQRNDEEIRARRMGYCHGFWETGHCGFGDRCKYGRICYSSDDDSQ